MGSLFSMYWISACSVGKTGAVGNENKGGVAGIGMRNAVSVKKDNFQDAGYFDKAFLYLRSMQPRMKLAR